jgi:hypothetical protein
MIRWELRRGGRRLATLLLVSLSIVAVRAQDKATQASRPFIGRWKLNAAKSDLTTTRLVFATSPAGDITMTMQGLSQTFRIDGKERPGMMGSTALWTETGPRSWRTVYRMARVDNNIDNYTLSADGQTLTMTTDFLVPTKSWQTMTFARISGRPGLMGTWQTKSLQGDSWLELTAADGARVSVHWLPLDGTAVVTPDGKEAPITGPPASVAPGMTAALKVTGPRTFDLSMKMNGADTAVGRFTVAADGKSMTVNSTFGPVGPAQEHATATYDKN